MRTRSAPVAALLLALAAIAPAGGAQAQELLWVETNYAAPLGRGAAFDGSGATSFGLTAGSLPEGVAFHAGKVYWAEAAFAGARILRANPDWSAIEVLVSGGSSFRGLAIDAAAGKMYWTSSNALEGARIRRANLDGTSVEILAELGSASNPRGIALDVAAGRMYWADFGLGRIRRANLDGSLVEDVVNATTPWGVAVHPTLGYLYYTSYGKGHLLRWPLAGGAAAIIRTGLGDPTYLAIDVDAGLVYWLDADANGPRLSRSTVDAVGAIEDLPVAITTYGGLALGGSPRVGIPGPAPVTRFALGPVTPNPASGPMQVEFALPRAARVRLAAIDVRGREVAVLVEGEHPAGRHRAVWPARTGAGPGIYFLRLTAPGIDLVQRCVRLP